MKHPLTNSFLANRINIDRFWPILIGCDRWLSIMTMSVFFRIIALLLIK